MKISNSSEQGAKQGLLLWAIVGERMDLVKYLLTECSMARVRTNHKYMDVLQQSYKMLKSQNSESDDSQKIILASLVLTSSRVLTRLVFIHF